MPKLKTRKTAAKRVKVTGTGKFLRNRANGRHILTKKNAKRKRRLRKVTSVKDCDSQRFAASMPYGNKFSQN